MQLCPLVDTCANCSAFCFFRGFTICSVLRPSDFRSSLVHSHRYAADKQHQQQGQVSNVCSFRSFPALDPILMIASISRLGDGTLWSPFLHRTLLIIYAFAPTLSGSSKMSHFEIPKRFPKRSITVGRIHHYIWRRLYPFNIDLHGFD